MITFQISLDDFEYWVIYDTIEELREGEKDCLYPPRFKIKCIPFDTPKPLCSNLEISKRFKDKDTKTELLKVIGEIPLIKIAAGSQL